MDTWGCIKRTLYFKFLFSNPSCAPWSLWLRQACQPLGTYCQCLIKRVKSLTRWQKVWVNETAEQPRTLSPAARKRWSWQRRPWAWGLRADGQWKWRHTASHSRIANGSGGGFTVAGQAAAGPGFSISRPCFQERCVTRVPGSCGCNKKSDFKELVWWELPCKCLWQSTHSSRSQKKKMKNYPWVSW